MALKSSCGFGELAGGTDIAAAAAGGDFSAAVLDKFLLVESAFADFNGPGATAGFGFAAAGCGLAGTLGDAGDSDVEGVGGVGTKVPGEGTGGAS
jgi:hypothetical protein